MRQPGGKTQIFARVFQKFTRLLALVAALLFVGSGLMLSYEVVARYFFTAPTIWAAELSQLCLMWGTLIAMAWALEARRHIAVDALSNQLSERARSFTDAFAMLFVAAFCLPVVWYGSAIFHDSFIRGRTTGSMLDLPIWVSELAVPVGFACLFVQALIEFSRFVTGMRTPTSGTET